MKLLLKKAVFTLLRWSGLPRYWRYREQRGRTTILCYHDPDPAVLAAHLRVLRRFYSIMPLRDFINQMRAGTLNNVEQYPLVITLDDGHRGNTHLLDLVVRENVPLTIFLCSGIVGTQRHFWWKEVDTAAERARLRELPDSERLHELARLGYQETASYPERHALSREEIQAMTPRIDFQAHTKLHPVLPRCTAARAHDEIAGCKKELEMDLGLDTYAFAYPNGDYCDRDAAIAAQAGYACALTIDAGSNDAHTDPYRLKRIIIPDDASMDEMVVKASGLWATLNRLSGRRSRSGYHAACEE